jgi:hypothetical protein
MCGLPPSIGLRQRVARVLQASMPAVLTLDLVIVDCQQFISEILSQLGKGRKIVDLFYRQLLTIGDLDCCIALDAETRS